MNAVLDTVLALILMGGGAPQDRAISFESPVFEVTLPSGYQPTTPRETPIRYTRPRGRDIWAYVSAIVVEGPKILPQERFGVRVEEILPCVPLPPDAKWTFGPLKWKQFDIGSIEYRAVVKDIPVLGLATVLPLQKGTVTILVYAPETMEKECREDFHEILSQITKAPTHWQPPEYFEKIRSMDRIGKVGLGLMALYPVAWAIFFRDDPLRAHWLRTAWLAVVAVLLFLPINSPGETTIANNLVVNALMPMVLLLFAVRRIRLGIELS